MIVYAKINESGYVEMCSQAPFQDFEEYEFAGTWEDFNLYPANTYKLTENGLVFDEEAFNNYLAEIERLESLPQPKNTMEMMADALDKVKPSEVEGQRLELKYEDDKFEWVYVEENNEE